MHKIQLARTTKKTTTKQQQKTKQWGLVEIETKDGAADWPGAPFRWQFYGWSVGGLGTVLFCFVVLIAAFRLDSCCFFLLFRISFFDREKSSEKFTRRPHPSAATFLRSIRFYYFVFFFRFRFDSAGVWNGRLEYWVLTEKLASSLFIAPHNERRLLVFFSFLFLSFVAPSGRSLANDHRRGLLLSFFLFFSILESVLSRSLKMVFGFDWISTGYLFFRRDQFLVLRGFPIKKCCLCKGVRLR